MFGPSGTWQTRGKLWISKFGKVFKLRLKGALSSLKSNGIQSDFRERIGRDFQRDLRSPKIASRFQFACQRLIGNFAKKVLLITIRYCDRQLIRLISGLVESVSAICLD